MRNVPDARRVALGATMCMALACGIDRFPTANVPDDSELQLGFACDKAAAPAGRECDVIGRVVLMTGDAAGANWTVDLATTGGSFIPVAGDSIIRVRRMTTGSAGEFTARYMAPVEVGDVTFTASATGNAKSETLKVVSADAGDEPPVATILLTPAQVVVKKGESTLVKATFLQADKTALEGRLAYFATDDPRTATAAAGPSNSAWVKGIDTGVTVLFVSRRAIHASASVKVQP